MEKYERSVFKDDDLLKVMSESRKSIYEHYSKYTHPSFLVCLLNSYTYSDNPNEILKFNVWGEESTRISKELISLCELNLIIYLELFYYIVGEINIKKYIFKDKSLKQMWATAINMYLLFKEYFFMVIKE